MASSAQRGAGSSLSTGGMTDTPGTRTGEYLRLGIDSRTLERQPVSIDLERWISESGFPRCIRMPEPTTRSQTVAAAALNANVCAVAVFVICWFIADTSCDRSGRSSGNETRCPVLFPRGGSSKRETEKSGYRQSARSDATPEGIPHGPQTHHVRTKECMGLIRQYDPGRPEKVRQKSGDSGKFGNSLRWTRRRTGRKRVFSRKTDAFRTADESEKNVRQQEHHGEAG